MDEIVGCSNTDGSDAPDQHLAAMQDLTEAMAEGGDSFQERVAPVLAVGREYLGFPNGHVTTVLNGEHTIVATDGLDELLTVGMQNSLSKTYCRHTLDEDGIYVIKDASQSIPDDPAYEWSSIRAYAGIPLRADKPGLGTVCFINDEDPLAEFSEWQRMLLQHISQWIEAEVGREYAAEQNEESRRLLEATFNTPETYIGIADADGTFIRANTASEEFIGGECSDWRGEPVWEAPWWDYSEAVKSRCRDAVTQAATGKTTQFEGKHVGEGGEQIRTAVTVRPVLSDGDPEKIIIEATDVTDLKQREEEMEFFNGVLRHGILNGMTVIEGRANLLSESLTGKNEGHAETILEWSQSISHLTQKVRRILHIIGDEDPVQTTPTELPPLIEESVEKITTIETDCTTQTDVDQDIEVSADSLLGDVIENIFMNAVEHGGPGPHVAVKTELEDSFVRLRIADDGPGIPLENRQAVFEKGERGAQSQGTGFGLYFVSAMIESYGGSIWVEDSDLGGSEFILELPLA
jgi:PAS domain S-box-containing protein